MVFKDIQAILMPEFTIITIFLNKPRISKEGRELNFEPEKILKIRPNHLRVFTREGCVENLTKEAF